MDWRELFARIAAYLDGNHPRLASALLKLRWGGLRTIRPDRSTWLGMWLLGAGLGSLFRGVVGRRSEGGHRLPLGPSLVGGFLAVWGGLWRFDALRWRRSHVTLVLDLPSDLLDAVIARLRSAGLEVERHERRRGVGGVSAGLTCRLRDLRRVNAELDALDAASGQRLVTGGV